MLCPHDPMGSWSSWLKNLIKPNCSTRFVIISLALSNKGEWNYCFIKFFNIDWMIRTFQLEVHEAMVWKGGKICRALSTFLVEWTLSGNRAKKSFLPKSDIAISKFVYVLEECEKRRKVDRETWSSSVAENYIRSSNEANWKRLS